MKLCVSFLIKYRMLFQCLIPLARVGTKDGKAKAAQALAKIAITSDPNTAFPGERVMYHDRDILIICLFFLSVFVPLFTLGI